MTVVAVAGVLLSVLFFTPGEMLLLFGHALWALALLGLGLWACRLISRRRQLAAGSPSAIIGQVDAVPVNGAGLSDRELCAAWCRSYVLLERVTLPADRARLALRRQSYLDELERRHPLTFARWLETEPRAAADPARYFDAHAD